MSASRTKELAEVLLEMTDENPEAREEAQVKKSLKEFATYLKKKGLLRKADAIIADYRRLYNKKHNIVEATVTLTSRLSEHTRVELREALKKKHNAREVHMLEKVDQRLIGGIRIQIEDEVYDSSIQNSLKQLQTELLK